ncbi:MAG: flippase-like domain-containing protein, partial [Marmoricola sp.]
GRAELVRAVRGGWRRMSAGVLLYLTLQAALLFACLAAVGAGAPVTVVLIACAIDRLISLAPITPGASGVAELGTVAALHSFGVDPVHAAAGVLLYRILMFAVEIPVGGAIAIGWLRSNRSRTTPEVHVVISVPVRSEVAA